MSMLSAFLPLIYVQISPERLTLTNPKTGQTLSEVPELALSPPPRRRILAAGPQARLAAASEPAEVVNPFAHPRSLISDFVLAEHLLKYQLRRLQAGGWLAASPHIVIHPLGDPEGGFTQVELRALRELGSAAGASKVNVWTGRPLTDEELLARKPPAQGGIWE
ncbi:MULTISPECIES: rod shape-determining protein [Delftia]|nr:MULTISPECIES: rod shape-determining protein [Delftia]